MTLHSADWLHCRTDTPLGPLTLARTARGLCGAWFGDQRDRPSATSFAAERHRPDDALLRRACEQLQAYFSGKRPAFDLPLDLTGGTPFQQAVWQALRHIPFGQTGSYRDVAMWLGKPSAARAVGGAIGRNPLSIIVPCHRVLGSGGQLTGYSGGLWRKQALLKLESQPLA